MKWGTLKDFHKSIVKCDWFVGYFDCWSLGEIQSEVLGSGKYSWPGLRKFRESSADTSSAPIRPWGWTVFEIYVCLPACATLSFSQLLTLGVHSRWSWLPISHLLNLFDTFNIVHAYYYPSCHTPRNTMRHRPSNHAGFSPGDAWEMRSKAVWRLHLSVEDNLFTNISPS